MHRFRIVLVAGLRRLLFAGFGGFALFLGAAPEAAAQTMVLPGKFDVSPQGQATFSIPISVPPGTAGMVPSLSIDYQSGGGSGLLGVGWGLDGLLAITRCPQTMAQNGAHGAVTYDVGVTPGQADTDRFCLNGQQLIAINGGTYGADGTQYRTEIEGFSEIISHGITGSSPSWFEVHTKSGQIMEFGNTQESPYSQVMLSGITSVRSWLLSKVSDTAGNYMTVLYKSNPNGVAANSEVEPTEIDYTGNCGNGLQVNYCTGGLAPYNKVKFIYATRPDIAPLYTGGALSELTQRMTDIETFSGTQSAPGSTEVNDYKLAYTTSPTTSRSLLASVTLCDAAGSNCLPARTFTYQVGGNGTFTEGSEQTLSQNFGSPPTANWALFSGDFTGNGKSDFGFITGGSSQGGGTDAIWTYLSNGDGTFKPVGETTGGFLGQPPTKNWTSVEGDFNADGKSDFGFVTGGGSNTIDFYTSNGDGTFTQTSTSAPGNLGNPPSNGWITVEGDFNGDGRTDIAFVGENTVYVLINNGNGTFTASTQVLNDNFEYPPQNHWTLFSGDFVGNGRTDFSLIIGESNRTQSGIITFLNNGDGTFTQVNQNNIPFYLGSPPSSTWTPITGDFNGDGLTDVAFISGNSTNNYNMVCTLLSNGNGTFTPACSNDSGYLGVPPSGGWIPFVGNFVGDGKTDIAFVGENNIYIMLSNGDGTFRVNTAAQNVSFNFGYPPGKSWTLVSGDFNGDGLTDFAMVSGDIIVPFLANGPLPDILTSFTNGLTSPSASESTSITYGTLPMGWGSYYSGWSNAAYSGSGTAPCSSAAATYPIIDAALPMPVVTSTSSTTGLAGGGVYKSNFTYACARVDASGRGYLGFSQQTVTDAQTGIEQTTNFRQDFPYTGLVSSQTKTLGGATLNNVQNTYAALTALNSTQPPASSPTLPWSGPTITSTLSTQVQTPIFPYLASSQVASSDLNGAAMPTATTNYTYSCAAYGSNCNTSYGDVYSVSTEKTLNSSPTSMQITTNSYKAPDLTNWFLGRLIQTQVVSGAPQVPAP